VNLFTRYTLSIAGVVLCLSGFLYFRDTKVNATEVHQTNNLSDMGARSIHAMNRSDSPFGLGNATEASNSQQPAKTDSAILYGRNGRIVDFDGLTALEYIAKWNGQARAGDVEAAYKLYQAESVCANNDDPVAEYADTKERDQFLSERKTLNKICQGVSPAQVQERLQFLALAARSGKVNAQIDFFMEGSYGRAIDLAENRDDPLVQKWKDDALNGLKSAAAHGEPFALGLLSMSYDTGELVPRDMKLALAYKEAEAEVRNTSIPEAQLRRKFGAQMSESDFDSALQLGKQMANDCCKK
jgi:hypothetical protein